MIIKSIIFFNLYLEFILMTIITSWQFAVFAHLICAMIFNQTYKTATTTMKNPGALTAMLEGMAGLWCFLLIPLLDLAMPTNPAVYFFLFVACIFYALNDRLTTDVRKGLDVSLVNIIKQLSSVFMIVAGIFIFKEKAVFTKVAGALLIIVSNVIVFYKKGTRPNKYVWTGLIATVFGTIALLIDVNYSEQFNLFLYVGITLFVPAVLIIAAERITPSKIITEYNSCNKSIIFATTISWAIMTFSKLWAYQIGEIIVVTPLCSLIVILNVALGYFFFGEKDNLLRKLFAPVIQANNPFLSLRKIPQEAHMLHPFRCHEHVFLESFHHLLRKSSFHQQKQEQMAVS